MRAVSIDRSDLALRALVSLINVVALACLAAVLAFWTWRWMLSPPEPASRGVVGITVGTSADANLFGSSGAAVATTTLAGIRLLGVVAGSGGRPGYAVMQLDGKPIVALLAGSELAPGLVLAEVHPRGVVLERSGIRETLALPPLAATAPFPDR